MNINAAAMAAEVEEEEEGRISRASGGRKEEEEGSSTKREEEGGGKRREERSRERPVMKVKPEYLLKEPVAPPRTLRRGGLLRDQAPRGVRAAPVTRVREARGPRAPHQRQKLEVVEQLPPPASLRNLAPPFPPSLVPPPLLPPPTLLLPCPLLFPIPIPIPIPIPMPCKCKCSCKPQPKSEEVPRQEEEEEDQADPPLVIDIKKEKPTEEAMALCPPLPAGTSLSLTPLISPSQINGAGRVVGVGVPKVAGVGARAEAATSLDSGHGKRSHGEEESRRKRRALIMDR